MNLDNFKVADFPLVAAQAVVVRGGFVYLFCFASGGMPETPFYVGQTDRFAGRMNDYKLANFSACTDFFVGEAAKYLARAKKFGIIIRYKATPSPRTEEKQIIRELLISGVRLLNCLPKYDYQTAREAEEREVIHKFCDLLVHPG